MKLIVRCLVGVWVLALAQIPTSVNSQAGEEAKTAEQRLQKVAFDQRLGEPLPEDTAFVNEHGNPVDIFDLGRGKPMVLVLSWFDCPNLCPMLLGRLAEAVETLDFDVAEYEVVALSIDPGEGPAEARAVQRRLVSRNADSVRAWTFLTGDAASIDKLAEAVGFRYAYDSKNDRYAHPAGLVIIAPGGTINRYLFGIDPKSPDLRLALLEAGRGTVGSAVDQVVLRCYRFNVESGQYNLAVMRLLQASGGVFIVAMLALIFWMRRRGPR